MKLIDYCGAVYNSLVYAFKNTYLECFKNNMLVHFLYIDPGSGSMLIQMLIGAAVAIGIFFKKIKIAFLQLFKKKNKTSAIEEEN